VHYFVNYTVVEAENRVVCCVEYVNVGERIYCYRRLEQTV